MAASYSGARVGRSKLKLEERRNANEQEEKFDDCHSGSQASVSGNDELVAAGQSVVVSNPNLAIPLPGGISLIVNEQTSSSAGNAGSMTVNALHVKGPSIDIVVASAQSGITCS
jgi:hypothetical protein